MTRDADSGLVHYIQRVKGLPALSREEEHELALRVRDHADEAAVEALVRANLKYVVAIAVTYRRYDLRLADLVAEGNVGLVTAVKKFDPDKGTRFVTYASYWIRALILNAVIKNWSLVGGGAGALRSKLFFRLRRERARMSNLVQAREEALDALAEQLGVSSERLEGMLQRLEGRDVSLDAPVFDDGHATGLDLLEDTTAPQDDVVAARAQEQFLGDRVRDAMASLDARERYIVEQRMLADNDEEASLASLGRELGVSRERARQLETRAKQKLRKHLEAVSA